MLLIDKRCYTGQIYYERKGYNKWQMKFIVVRDIDAFVKVYTLNTHYTYIIIILLLYSTYLLHILIVKKIK